MAKVKHGTYELQDCDADLQNDPPRHPAVVVAQWPALFDQALKIIFEKVAIYTEGQLKLTRKDLGSQFFATKVAPISRIGVETSVAAAVSGKVPVEWKLRTQGGHGTSATNWQLMIDLDDIPPGVKVSGPDRPHIGYLLTGKGHWTARVDGHIFIEHVIATRNAPGEEETAAAEIFMTPMGAPDEK
jgi:hypothetical protein